MRARHLVWAAPAVLLLLLPVALAGLARGWWRAAARRAGLQVGAYHFFTFCRSAEAQARHFLSVVPAPDALPAALDVELGGNCRTPPDDAASG